MNSSKFIRYACLLSVCLGLFAPASYAAATNEELQRMINQLQAQINALQTKLNDRQAEETATEQKIEQQQAQIEALAEQQESQSAGSGVNIGGYGELHYNNLDGEGGASDKDEVDFHRFVLFFSKEFTNRLRFVSELEVEHALAGEGKNGEVEVEQAFIEYDINDRATARGGLFLVPVGILNETHEPPTFYGVERNPVENAIIPSTWWAGGAGMTYKLTDALTWDGAIHEGLKTSGPNFAIRGGRQKTSEADASDLAFTSRLKWTGMPGLEIAGTFQYQSDMTQDGSDTVDEGQLYEAHAVFNRGRFGLRALYAMWDIQGDGAAAVGADEQSGFYIEPSWKVSEAVGVFARYSLWDNQAGDDSIASEKRQWNVGANWWLHENVVVKADFQEQDNENDQNQSGFNLGVGYMF